jgi:hypothetical protein
VTPARLIRKVGTERKVISLIFPQRGAQGTSRHVINYISVCVRKVVQFLLLFKNMLIIDTFNYANYSEDGFRPEI